MSKHSLINVNIRNVFLMFFLTNDLTNKEGMRNLLYRPSFSKKYNFCGDMRISYMIEKIGFFTKGNKWV